MSNEVALDLFCGPGGVTRVLLDRGYEVIGVDLERHRHYPEGATFIELDLDFGLDEIVGYRGDYDFLWTSPPCQRYTNIQYARTGKDLMATARELARRHASDWVIENVPGARESLYDPILLCGSMFGAGIRKHRLFEISGMGRGSAFQPDHDCQKRYDYCIGDREHPVTGYRKEHGFPGCSLGAKDLRHVVPRYYVNWLLDTVFSNMRSDGEPVSGIIDGTIDVNPEATQQSRNQIELFNQKHVA